MQTLVKEKVEFIEISKTNRFLKRTFDVVVATSHHQ